MASTDLESPPPVSYSPLPSSDLAQPGPAAPRRRLGALCLAALLLALAAAVRLYGSGSSLDRRPVTDQVAVPGRGVREGVSSKSSGAPTFLKSDSGAGAGEYAWSITMLSWQRTGFHFQPERNWMNDPNGPMFYNGRYHLFYQYNPKDTAWETRLSWGHAISHDLLNWIHLPVALSPDKWYDSTGVWSGSATVLPDGRIYMIYTGLTDEYVELQNVAVPSNLSDPFLIEWEKINVNPIMYTPPGVGPEDFRDPSTAWYEYSDSTWRVAVGSLNASSHSGICLVYSTKDFRTFSRVDGILHAVEKVGMWECIDLYPIAVSGSQIRRGLDSTVMRPSDEIKHVLKASTQDENSDYYAIGTYDAIANKWTPDDESLDVGVGLRYDWGKFYASKSFYDPKKQRRILWGWVAETDTESADKSKGWASLQGIPRTILFDTKTRSNLLTWPIEEVESLRVNGEYFQGISVGAGSTFELVVGSSTSQLDIEAEFEVNKEALEAADVETYDCTTSGGAATRGIAGPFGLLVLANEVLTEQTAVYFYISKGSDGNLKTHFCQDESRSSKANDVVKRIAGHTVPVLEGETLALRILVDHSIVESFAQGGRASVTSRVYPTEAINNDARVFLFNNATNATLTAKTLKIWQMQSAHMQTLHLPN